MCLLYFEPEWQATAEPSTLLQDTFLDAEHLSKSFPEYKVEFKQNAAGETVRPFRITFPEAPAQEQPAGKGKRKVS